MRTEMLNTTFKRVNFSVEPAASSLKTKLSLIENWMMSKCQYRLATAAAAVVHCSPQGGSRLMRMLNSDHRGSVNTITSIAPFTPKITSSWKDSPVIRSSIGWMIWEELAPKNHPTCHQGKLPRGDFCVGGFQERRNGKILPFYFQHNLTFRKITK